MRPSSKELREIPTFSKDPKPHIVPMGSKKQSLPWCQWIRTVELRHPFEVQKQWHLLVNLHQEDKWILNWSVPKRIDLMCLKLKNNIIRLQKNSQSR